MTKVTSIFVCLWICVLSVTKGFTQNKGMDSLTAALKKVKDDTTKVQLLVGLVKACDVGDNLKYGIPLVNLTDKLLATKIDSTYTKKLIKDRLLGAGVISFYYRNTEPDNLSKITAPYVEHINVCKKFKDPEGISDALLAMASAYNSQGELMKKLRCLKLGDSLMQAMNHKKGQARFILQLAFFYAGTGDTAQALNYTKKGEMLEQNIGDSTRISRGYILRGQFFFAIGKSALALQNLKEAERRYKLVSVTAHLVEIYNLLGNIYCGIQDYRTGISYYQICSDLAKKTNNFEYITLANNSMGDAYTGLNNYAEAISTHLEVLELYNTAKDDNGYTLSSYHLARDYYLMGNYKAARPIIEKVLTLATKIGHIPYLMTTEKMV